MLKRIIPPLLKMKPCFDHSRDFLIEFGKEKVDHIDLAQLFQNYILDNDWLKHQLADIEGMRLKLLCSKFFLHL